MVTIQRSALATFIWGVFKYFGPYVPKTVATAMNEGRAQDVQATLSPDLYPLYVSAKISPTSASRSHVLCRCRSVGSVPLPLVSDRVKSLTLMHSKAGSDHARSRGLA